MNLIIEQDIDSIIKGGIPWEEFYHRTVVVTGAAGFLPSYMVSTLLRLNEIRNAGIEVVGLVRSSAGAKDRYGILVDSGKLKLLVQDVSSSVPDGFRADYIIHAASHASPKYYGSDPVGTLLPNTIGTRNMLELARRSGARGFLFLSAGEVYGEVPPDRIPTREKDFGFVDCTDLRSCYAESKRIGETMCVAYSSQYGVPAKIVRPYHTYGPGMTLDDGRVFSDFVADILARRDIVLKSDGSASRAFCYISEAVAGFFTVLLKGKAGEAYNVGSDKATSILQLAQTLANLFPERGQKVVRQEGGRPEGYIQSRISCTLPDISKIRALGWDWHVGVEEGFRRTILSYEQDEII